MGIGQAAGDVFGLQRDVEVLIDQGLGHHVPRLVEVDVLLVERIPEVVVGGADDLVEGVGPLTVAVEIEHGLEIVRRDRVVHGVLGDVTVGHAHLSHQVSSRHPCIVQIGESTKLTGASLSFWPQPFSEDRRRLDLVAEALVEGGDGGVVLAHHELDLRRAARP